MGKVAATLFDCDGLPFIEFRGTAQDVGDSLAIYVQNVSDPLSPYCQQQFIERVEKRDERQEDEDD